MILSWRKPCSMREAVLRRVQATALAVRVSERDSRKSPMGHKMRHFKVAERSCTYTALQVFHPYPHTSFTTHSYDHLSVRSHVHCFHVLVGGIF
jgi:hypothetical protein